ncbi:hypothetical protein, partial [Bradyrhizobium elkanii]|uniref:hypothetical protein n=1 Tax=Bradyrhizobium elkanii TaxID=29448 RepID=UPI001AECDA6F
GDDIAWWGALNRELILIVVPAKAGTHNPKCKLLRDAGTTSPTYNACRGYGSRPSPIGAKIGFARWIRV